MTITLPEDLAQELAHEAATTGRSADELVVEALYEGRERAEKQRLYVENALLESLDSGPAEPATEEFWDELRAEVMQRAQARRDSQSSERALDLAKSV